MLRCDASYFAFFHKSLVEYFTQQHLFNDACMAPEVVALENAAYSAAKKQGKNIAQSAAMNGKLLVKEHNLISMLAQRVLADTIFRNKLYDLVTCSCQNSHFSTAAANAITILKNANQPLNKSERNWQGLRIPGADLSYAILESVQWQGGDLRGVNFYGAYLKDADFKDAKLFGCQWPTPDKLQAMTFLGFPLSVTAQIYTWDGEMLIIGDTKGNIAFYSTATYQQLQTVKQYSWYNVSFNYPVTALAVDGGLDNRKSSLLASSSTDIYLWKLPSGKYLGNLTGHKNPIDDLQLSADGKKLVSHGTDGSIWIWNTQKQTLIKQVKVESNYFSKINFKIEQYQSTPLALHTIYVSPKFSYFSDKHPDEKDPDEDALCDCYFKGPYDHIQKTRIMLSHKEIDSLNSLSDKPSKLQEKILKKIAYREYVSPSVALSPSGKNIIFIEANGRLNNCSMNNISSFSQHDISQILTEHLKQITYLRFSPDGRYLAACSSKGKIILWSLETDEAPAILTATDIALERLMFSIDGEHIAAVSSTTAVWINLHHNTSRLIYRFTYSKDALRLALSIDSSQIALNDSDGIILCSISSDTYTRQMAARFLMGSILSPQSHFIYSEINKQITLFSAETGLLEHATKIKGDVLGISTDESCFFYSEKESVYQYSFITGKQRSLRKDKCLKYLTLCSPNGKYVVKGKKTQIKLFALDQSQRDHELIGHKADCHDNLFFSPNGAWLASTSWDKTVCVWSTTTGQKQVCFTGHRGMTGAIELDSESDSEEGFGEVAKNLFKLIVSYVDVPSCATFSPDSSVVASASGGFASYTVFIYTPQGQRLQKLVNYSSASLITDLCFSPDGKYLAVIKLGYPLKAKLHLWDWEKACCLQRIVLAQGGDSMAYSRENFHPIMRWKKNTIRILIDKHCLTFYKEKNKFAYRLSGVIGAISPNLKKLSLQGSRGLTKKQHQLLKAQGAQGKPKAFVHIVNDELDAIAEKKELGFLMRCRKGLMIQNEYEYACPALFEPQKHINNDRWHVTLFRITQCTSESTSNISNRTQASTSQGAIDFHVYGFIEGLDATGRSVMIQFDLVEDRNCPKYARIKNKCVITDSRDLKVRQQAFMTMFNREKSLPAKLCLQLAGTLNAENRDKLLDVIIDDQQRQFEAQDEWEERRIQYQKIGGSEKNTDATFFSANCLTWLRRILQPYKLKLPHSIWDKIAVNPRYTLSEGSFFQNKSCKTLDVSEWGKSVENTPTKSFK